MGLFGKKDPQAMFEDMDFMVTRILLEAPRMAPLPSVYIDEPSRKWAVKMPAADPVVFSCDDIVECEVVEGGGQDGEQLVGRREFAGEIIKNPARAARINASRKGYCLGLGVALAVKVNDGISVLQLPLSTQELKRSSTLYKRLREGAEEIRDEFLRLRDSADA